MVTPLPLPENFNPGACMIAKTTEYGQFHESRQAARLAADLIANGTPEDLALAEKVLDAVLACQELDANDPHVGNFYWMAEDSVVEDLNAVEFVLEKLIPMMLQHSDRLPAPLRQRVRQAIRLGLEEIRRLDVLVAYTNITMLDILNSCLGGELLQDPSLAERGYRKLAAWIAFTNQSGHPFEFNSPTYTAVTLRALKQLADYTQHEETRQRAQAMTARLALSAALHIHPGTGRWAGPHGRAYHPSVICETSPEVELLRGWIDDGTVPAWIAGVLDHAPTPAQVVETVNQEWSILLTTYQTPEYALGVAGHVFSPQANVAIIQYRRPTAERPGVFYSRYVLDDKWFGDSYHATDRTKTRNLPDEASFYGVQSGNRAIGVYSPTTFGQGKSAKAAFIWTIREEIDEIWIGDQQVKSLPVSVPPDEVVVVGSGQAYIALRPLHVTALSRETPLILCERDGDLVLEIYNYKGPEKRFWELRNPAFFQGHPICAFYLEAASRHEYANGGDLARAIKTGTVEQSLHPAYTYPLAGERPYRVSYSRDALSVGIDVDLMTWKLRQRWTQDGEVTYPMLESPVARQSRDGELTVGDAHLSWDGGEPAWLWACPQDGRWVAGYLGLSPADLTLKTPEGTIQTQKMSAGLLIWEDGKGRAEGEQVTSNESMSLS
jgi:hypothetical protein